LIGARRASISTTRGIRLALAVAVLAGLVVIAPGPGSAGAAPAFKGGLYKGKTTQEAVTSSYRKVQFTLKKGKVTLTVEPVVAKGVCLSTPVFTLDGPPTKKLSKSGAFTFTHTYMGNKFDKISGRFTSPDEVEGFAIYHFPAQDLCSEGKVKVTFTAKHS
jgi:hypothetical protein